MPSPIPEKDDRETVAPPRSPGAAPAAEPVPSSPGVKAEDAKPDVEAKAKEDAEDKDTEADTDADGNDTTVTIVDSTSISDSDEALVKATEALTVSP